MQPPAATASGGAATAHAGMPKLEVAPPAIVDVPTSSGHLAQFSVHAGDDTVLAFLHRLQGLTHDLVPEAAAVRLFVVLPPRVDATAPGAGGLLAALSVPWLVNRIGLAKTALVSMAFIPVQALMYMYFSVFGIPAWSLLLPSYVFIAWLVSFYGYAASISRFRWVSKGQAGTDYAVQSSIWNLGVSGGASLSGFAVGLLGWTYFFPLAALILLIGGMYYVLMFEHIEVTVIA